MFINHPYSPYPPPSFSLAPHFFIAGLHRNWHPAAARGLSAVTSNGLDVIDYAMGYKLVRRALAFFQHLCSRPGFVLPSFHFFLGPSFSEKPFWGDRFSPYYPALIFGKYLAGLFSNFRRLRKLKRFSYLRYPPRAVFLIDTKRANAAANELSHLSLPLGALCGSSVDPTFIPYPVLSNYSVQSMSFFFKLFSSVAASGKASSNLSLLLRSVSSRRRSSRFLRASYKVFGPRVRPEVHRYFSKLIRRVRLMFFRLPLRLRLRFRSRRKRVRKWRRLPSMRFLRSRYKIPVRDPSWYHLKKIYSPAARICLKVRLAYFLKNPLLFWSKTKNIFKGFNPRLSYETCVSLRLFFPPPRLATLYSVYKRLRPFFFLITVLYYLEGSARPVRGLSSLFLFRGFMYGNLYRLLLSNRTPPQHSPAVRVLPSVKKEKGAIDRSRLRKTIYPPMSSLGKSRLRIIKSTDSSAPKLSSTTPLK